MTKRNPTARAMSLACEVMDNKDVPEHLRAKAKDILAEHSPEVLDPKFDPFKALLMRAAEKCKLSSIKPSDLKPAPADGKLVRDANALDWLSKAEFLTDEAKCSFQQGNMTAYRQLLGGASTAMERAIGAMTDTANTAAISAIFTDAVKAEEADEDTKPARIPSGACRMDFGPDAKHFAYFSYSTSELFVGMTGEGAVVDENTLIEVLAQVNPHYLKTIYVSSFASIYPASSAAADKAPIDVFVCDLGKFDLIVCDFVVPVEKAAAPIDDAKVRTDALKTLRDLMTDEYVPHAIRADIAKYVIESRIG